MSALDDFTRKQRFAVCVEKITGKSPFHGRADETVFCGRWDTRL